MNGKITVSYNGCLVVFDFDNYTLHFSEEIPIDVLDKIQKLDEYLFLYECLITKHSYLNGYLDSDEEKYNHLQSEFVRRFSNN